MLKEIKSFLKNHENWNIEVVIFIAEDDVCVHLEALKEHSYNSDYDKSETICINEIEYKERWKDGQKIAETLENDFLKINKKLNLEYKGIVAI